MRKQFRASMRATQQEFVYRSMNIVAEFYGGETTLNQIRVAQYVNWQSGVLDHPTTHQEICAALDMPPSTVTRAIAKFINLGWLIEKTDPDDGRKRINLINLDNPKMDGSLDYQLLQLAAEMFKAEDRVDFMRDQGYTVTRKK